MICRHCNQEIPDGSAFCPHCGTNTSEVELHPNPVTSSVGADKQKVDICLQQIFSLVIGVVFVFICGFIGKWLAGNLIGMGGTLASQIADSFIKATSVILAIIGAIFAIVLHKQDAQKRIQTNKIALIVFSALQAVLLLILFFGGRIIISLYLGAIGGGAYNAVITSTLRTTAIPMLMASVVAILLGKFIKRKSLLLVLLIDFIAFILSVAVTVLYAQAGAQGMVPLAAGVGIGIMQPIAVLLPSIGWDYNKPAQKQAVATNDGHADRQAGGLQRFCPQCGTRFPAGKSYCDQCGAELKAVSQPEPFATTPVSTNTQDAPSGGFAVLSFFFPIVGLILYLVWHDTLPLRAKSAGKGALAGVITSVGLSILAVLLQLAAFSRLF